MERWTPKQALSKQEAAIIKRFSRVRKFLAFLRLRRHELFDEEFQAELESMYRDTGAGKDPVAPALMAMATLLQGYLAVSDATMVELTVIDLSVQMVLGHLGNAEPAFSQGAFSEFRARFIRADMDRRLLERTLQLARDTKEFDWRKLPKDLRIAFDSSPLEGAGRVEDTINLLAHAARKVVQCAATLLSWPVDKVCRQAGIPLLLESSVKKALDREWSNPAAKAEAVQELVDEITSLENWLQTHLAMELAKAPLKGHVETLRQIKAQDLEPDPGGGGARIRDGVAPERRVSIEDPEMRHGRKSKSKRFNGYKRHIARHLDSKLILSCALAPANRPEEEAAAPLKADIERQNFVIGELFIDRGYINSPVTDELLKAGAGVNCKPYFPATGKVFPKSRFKLNMRDLTITCPAGEIERFELGADVEFNPEACARCPLRAQCTTAAPAHGRTVTINENERLQQRLRKVIATPSGRARLRQRTGVEHGLAHIGRRQGRRARYLGSRKNLFDLRRAAAIQNIETIHLKVVHAEARKAA
jgi:Transposase DDE domain/Transposase domain (DUF772)